MKSPAEKRYRLLLVTIITCGLFSVVTLIVGWFYLSNISKDFSDKKTESRFLSEESSIITASLQRYNRVSEYSPAVLETLPSSKEVSSFIADVSKIAASNSLKISQSTIGGQSKGKIADLNFSQTIVQGDYYELQIKYTVEGSYQSFIKMLGDLGTLRRLNNISSIVITKSMNDPAGDTVQATFVDSIYIKK